MKTRCKLSILGAVLAAPLALSTVAGATGPSLLDNGDFSAGTTNWTTYQGFPATAILIASDALVVVNESDLDTGTFGAAGQCVPGITSGKTYFLEADAFDPSAQSRDGDAVLRIFWYGSGDCSGGAISAPIGPNSNSEDTWEHLVQESAAPDGANSARVLLISSKDKAEGNQPPHGDHVIHFDNVSFHTMEDPTPGPTEVPEEPTETGTETPGAPDMPDVTSSPEATSETTPPADKPAEPTSTSVPGSSESSGVEGQGEPAGETPVAGSAPAAPNTGTGTGADGGSSLGLLVAGLVVAAGASASGAALILGASRRRRQ
jgi:hypothetical protein